MHQIIVGAPPIMEKSSPKTQIHKKHNKFDKKVKKIYKHAKTKSSMTNKAENPSSSGT